MAKELKCYRCACKSWKGVCDSLAEISKIPCDLENQIELSIGTKLTAKDFEESVYFVEKGVFAKFDSYLSDNGNSKKANPTCLTLKERGDILGVQNVFANQGNSISYEAITPALIMKVPKSELRDLTLQDPILSGTILKYIIHLEQNSRRNLIKMSKGDLDNKTADLLYLLSQFEEFKLFESESAKITLNQEYLSRLLGCARESLNRALKRLEKAEVISIQNNQIHVLNRFQLAQKSAA